MSFKSALIFSSIFCCAVGLAYILHVSFKGDIYSKRSPSSESEIHLKGVKKDILIYKHDNPVSHTEKLKAPIHLEFLPVSYDEGQTKTNGLIDLRISVSSTEDLAAAELHWSLPEGVRLISGQTDELISIQADEPREFALYVQIDDLTKNHQVHVYLSSKYSHFEFSTVAQWESKSIFTQDQENENMEMQSVKTSVDAESEQPVFLE